jgi:hypothetical protein
MARRCPPGVFCLENVTMLFFGILLIAVVFFVHSKFYRGYKGGASVPSTVVVSSSSAPLLDFGGGGPSYNQDVLMNPHVPPLRDNSVGATSPSYDLRGGIAVLGGGGGGMRVNVPTQAVDTSYRQVGILTRPNGQETILPLMGRPLFTNRDKWQFYTLSDKNNAIKLPVSVNGRSGTGEYGCDNVMNGDTVFVEGYNDAFKVTVYDTASVRYLPF